MAGRKRTDTRGMMHRIVNVVSSNKILIAIAVSVPVVIWALRSRAKRRELEAARQPLADRVAAASAKGLESGLIVPLATDDTRVVHINDADDSPVMVVHVRSPKGLKGHDSTGKYASAGKRDAFRGSNPLFVTDLFGTHRVVMNKFPLIPRHVVVHTLDFIPQAGHLSIEDFAATWYCTKQLDGVSFFNSGTESGASQPRRHMQVIPLEAIESKHGSEASFPPLPVEALISNFRQQRDWKYDVGKPFRLDEYDFQHAVSLHGGDVHHKPLAEACAVLYSHYMELVKAVGLTVDSPAAYNFLMTPTWMMVIPRGREKWQGIPFNAMVYSGIVVLPTERVADFAAAPLALLRSISSPVDA